MDEFVIDTKLKEDIDARLRLVLSDKAIPKSELQDGGSFILITAELNYHVLAVQVLDLFDEIASILNSILPEREVEPRWMLSFNVKERILYANMGGLAGGAIIDV